LKVKKHDAYIQVKLPSELKKAAEKKLSEMGYSISEFVREKLREVVEKTEGEEQI
jgi:antitoxin component of RelBE/YafQ-DinJ toxin-antitoxin module